ncbi:MAG: hypothetical protein KDG49_22405 [Geminicoccaceae bacterium]|nr:hypothetical protein [Geminicoccaceae bacterium]
MPNHVASALALVLAAGLLAACDPGDLNPLASEPRPPVSVTKEVTMVSAAELVGSWTCRELNPYPDQPPIETQLDIRDDGTLTSEALLPMDQEMPGAGDLILTIDADWQVEGDRMVTTNTQGSTRAADGSTGSVSALLNQAMAAFTELAADGTSEVLKVDARELVMRGDEPDAPTVSCQRAS